MKVFNVSMMLAEQLICILLFLSWCASVFSFPSTPLNERSQEISWQAWLLVDDQNQNRQNSDGVIPRRRITPKSVFVAPTFSPESLPPCAEGYSSDDMGRCIKIIKLDEDKHLAFLVNNIHEKFGVIDYEEDIEIDSTKSEPFQLNIPFSLDEDYSNDTPQEDVAFAIIVTPTTKDSDKSKVDKRNDQSSEDMYEKELKKLMNMATTKKYDDTTSHLEVERSTGELSDFTTTFRNVGEEETETATASTVEEMETTTVVMATDDHIEETTTLGNVEDALDSVTESFRDVDVTTSTDSTTTLEGTTEDITTVEPTMITKISTKTPKITTYHPKAITYHPYFDMSLLSNSKIKNLIKFPDDELAIPRSHPDGGFVRFPDVDSKYQQESQGHHTRDVNEQSGNYFNEIVTPEPSQRVQEKVVPPKGYFSDFLPSNAPYPTPKSPFFPTSGVSGRNQGFHLPLVNHQNFKYQIGATTENPPGKKTKEKHSNMFLFPPAWPENQQQKPLVLRFNRKHFNIDTHKFKNHEFYRSLPMDDLSVLFGYKQGQTSHR